MTAQDTSSPTLKQIAAATPCLPAQLHVPSIPDDLDKLVDSLDGIPKAVNENFHWRRNYDDPIKFMLISASDSDASPELKRRALQRLHDLFAVQSRKYIPQRTLDGKFINTANLDGTYYEHSLIDYLIPYVTLYDKSEASRTIVHNYCRWVIWDQEHGTKGHRQQPDDSTFYSRAWMRRVWLLIAFGDSPIVPIELRTELHRLATREINWLIKSRTDGSIESVGWSTRFNVIYMNQDASNSRKARVVHVYFLEVLNDILVRIVNTQFYVQNKSLVDTWITQAKKTSETLVESSGPIIDGKLATLTSYRGDQWFLDTMDGEFHKVTPTGADYAPAMLWMSLEDSKMLKGMVRECRGEWLPNFRWNVSHAIRHSMIVSTRESRTTPPAKE